MRDRLPGHGSDLVGELATVKPVGDTASASTAARTWRIRGLVEIDAADTRCAELRRHGSSSRMPSGMKPTSTQSRPVQNRSVISPSRRGDVAPRSRTRPHPRSRVLWAMASTRSTCSPLVYAFNVKRPKWTLKLVRS